MGSTSLHKNILRFITATFFLPALARSGSAAESPYLHAPSVDTYAKHDPAGLTKIADKTAGFLTPAGSTCRCPRGPYGLAMTRDGACLFVASEGVGQIISDWQNGQPKVTHLNPLPVSKRRKRANTGGADFSPDGKTLYWSGGESGAVMIFDVSSGMSQGEVALNAALGARTFETNYVVDLKVSCRTEDFSTALS